MIIFSLVSCLTLVRHLLTLFLWGLYAVTRLVFNRGVVGEGLTGAALLRDE